VLAANVLIGHGGDHEEAPHLERDVARGLADSEEPAGFLHRVQAHQARAARAQRRRGGIRVPFERRARGHSIVLSIAMAVPGKGRL
jgi:hypothetical protein